jgi:hypothetical protein
LLAGDFTCENTAALPEREFFSVAVFTCDAAIPKTESCATFSEKETDLSSSQPNFAKLNRLKVPLSVFTGR